MSKLYSVKCRNNFNNSQFLIVANTLSDIESYVQFKTDFTEIVSIELYDSIDALVVNNEVIVVNEHEDIDNLILD